MQEITINELKERLDAGEQINIIDVREPAEHAEFNIGGILLPLGNIMEADTETIDDLKDKEVILYCRSGARSGRACLMLETIGFQNVKNLSGGMLAWQQTYGG